MYYQTAVIIISLVALTYAAKEQCDPHHHPIVVPINVRLLFAGSVPLFMRHSSWNTKQKNHFLSQLASTVRRPALQIDDRNPAFTSPILTRSKSTPLCSVVEYSYSYDMSIIDQKTTNLLDSSLSTILNKSDSNYAHAPLVANTFFTLLSRNRHIPYLDSLDIQQHHDQLQTYYILIYNTFSVAPQYGYKVEPSGPVLTVGMASSVRFGFIDVSARPFLFQDGNEIAPGELLTTSARSFEEYASTLHSIISDTLLTPPVSTHMRQFPHESRIHFSLNRIDASSISLPFLSSSKTKCRNIPMGKSLNQQLLIRALHSAFDHISKNSKDLSLELHTPNMNNDAKVAMSVTRSLSVNGPSDLLIDSNQLFHDIVDVQEGGESERSGLFVDSSFVLHVPLYLFSFCEDKQSAHLDIGKHIHGTVVGKKAIFLIENRLYKSKISSDHEISMTTESVVHILKLLCGLVDKSLVHLNVMYGQGMGIVPRIVKDQIARNLIVQKVDWSEQGAASKAEELLNFEGLDAKVVSHEQGSAIEKSRIEVKEGISNLRDVWKRTARQQQQFVLDGDGEIEMATTKLAKVCETLASKLHTEICHQRFSKEVLIKTEVDVQDDNKIMDDSLDIDDPSFNSSDGTSDISDDSWLSFIKAHLTLMLLSSLLGIIIGYVTFKPPQKNTNNGLRDLVLDNSSELYASEAQSPTTHWFSTLHPAQDENKSKTS